MTDEMVRAYLERLECTEATAVSRENLFRIQEAHFHHIPYENLDIFLGKGVTPLDTDYLFDKIVRRHRGGYCFELNGLLGELLRSLGYPVVEYFARWHFGETKPVPMRRHRVLRVTAEGKDYIVDAGVASRCPLQPLPFAPGVESECQGRVYRIVADAVLGDVVQVKSPEADFVPLYSFTTDPAFPQDFVYVHYYCSTSPDSVFRQRPMANIYTADCKKWLAENPDGGRVLLESHLGEEAKVIRQITTDDELLEVLAEEFHIQVLA